MDLFINTAEHQRLEVAILKDGDILDKKNLKSEYNQAEKLLPTIDKLLIKNNFKLKDIKKVIVENKGGGFTAMRVGVVTANALAYALGVPIEARNKKLKPKKKGKVMVIEPEYDREPNIG